MRHIWAERLNVRVAIRALASSLLRPTVLFTDSISPGAARVLAAARRLGFRTPEQRPTRWSLAVHDETGRNIRARIEEKLARLTRSLFPEHDDFSWLPNNLREYGAEWTRILASRFLEENYERLNYLAFMENCYRTGAVLSVGAAEVIFVLQDVSIPRYAARNVLIDIGRPCHVVFPIGLTSRHMRRSFVHAHARLVRLAIRTLLRCRAATPARQLPSVAVEKGSILVQYQSGLIDHYPFIPTIDWFEGSGLEAGRLVFMCNRVDSPHDAALQDWCRKKGFGWIDYVTPPDHLSSPFSVYWRQWKLALSALGNPLNEVAIWRWLALLESLPLLECHRSLLRSCKAVTLHQHTEFISYQMLFALAARMEGVLFPWSFWSFLYINQACFHHAFVDLYLCWGPYDLGLCNVISFDYRYAVQTGLTGFDGTTEREGERASEIRGRFSPDVRFVVCIFDSGHAERSIHQSTEQMLHFYRSVLGMIAQHPDWGCVIKSRGPVFAELPATDGIQDVVGRLTNEGRAIVLSSYTRPSLALAASDAAVAFGANSAGVIASLSNTKPILYFDLCGSTFHPFVHMGKADAIFLRDAATVHEALRAIASGSEEWGDHRKFRSMIDPFCDGRGRIRAGELLRMYVAGRDSGLDLDEALRRSVEAYGRKWGADKVDIRREHQPSAAEILWQNVLEAHYPMWPSDYPETSAAHASTLSVCATGDATVKVQP